MALPKFTDKMKIDRAKANVLRSLEEIRSNSNKAEALGFVTGQLAHLYAMLDAQKVDEMAMVYVAVQIMDEINPRPKDPVLGKILTGTQLELTKK